MSIRMRDVLKLTLGGAVWGCLLGTVLGAVIGVIYGALAGDVSLGLDGAVLCCFALTLLGGAYGLALGLRGHRRRPAPDEVHPASWEGSAPGVATSARL